MKGRKRLDFSDSRFRLRNIFYIHCPGYPKENWLRREIIKFGGKVESFLSKDVHVLITNQAYNENKDSFTPHSPIDTCTSSSRMWVDSPLSTEKPTAVVTRGKALALQAAKNQCNGSTDVVENSRRLGVRVWSLEAAVRAIKKAKREENRRNSKLETPNDLDNGMKRLKAPFMKVEDSSNRFKPLFVQFESWPVMDYLEKHNLDPGFQNGKPITPKSLTPITPKSLTPITSTKSNTRVQPVVSLQRISKLHRNPLLNTQPAQVLVGKSPVQTIDRKESTPMLLTLKHEPKVVVKKQQTERRGYCEACLLRYSSLHEHRQSFSHQQFISNSENFVKLDKVISDFLSIQQVATNFSSLTFLLSQPVSQSVADVSSDTSHNPLLSPIQTPQQSPFAPSKVRDSSRHTPQIGTSFHLDVSFLPYKPTSPQIHNSATFHSFITDPEATSAPRVLKPRTRSQPTSANNDTNRRSYTIPIDTPKHGTKQEITLLIPSSGNGCSSMELCESISHTCPPQLEPAVQAIPSLPSQPVKQTTDTEYTPEQQDVSSQTPEKPNRSSRVWIGDAKTPPLPKGMDPRLFMFLNYPYRESKVNAFKKLSKLL